MQNEGRAYSSEPMFPDELVSLMVAVYRRLTLAQKVRAPKGGGLTPFYDRTRFV